MFGKDGRNSDMRQLTWRQFKFDSVHRKMFLFGVGIASKSFIVNYYTMISLEGVIDNDRKKQGFYLSDFVAESLGTPYENLIISDVSILENYEREELAIVIASTNYCEQIAEQLERLGISHYYLLQQMNQWTNKENISELDDKLAKDNYINTCCSQNINWEKIVVYIGYYGGHGKYITEQLLTLRRDIDIVWIVKDLTIEKPEGIRLIFEGNWKRYIYEMETAHIWIYDIIIPTYIRKRQQQIYIQTKHWASVTLKKFFLDDASSTKTEEEINKVTYNGKIMDYILTGSEFDNVTCKSGFAFQGDFVQVGSARSDLLFRMGNKDKIYNRYHIDSDCRCILYAPTFRYEKSKHKKFFNIGLDFERLRQALSRRFGGEWCILLRLHPSIIKAGVLIEKNNYVIDVGDYGDSQELVAASDITISDYSSIMFEPAFVYKPVFLFAQDREHYVNKERDLLIDYDTLPFPMAETNEKLIQNIEEFNQIEYEKNVKAFFDKYGIHEDGHASERAAKFILGLLESKE